MNLIAKIFERHPPDAPAIVAGGHTVTYAELLTAARPISARIRAANTLGRRPRIGLHCPNGIDYIVHAIGILLADACLVPLAEELTIDERQEIIRTTALDFTITTEGLTVVEGGPPPFPEDRFQALNPAFIRFSSGTTGTSKGVVLSHETLLARITAANRGLRLSPADRVLWMLPMAHHFAVSIVLYLWSGAVTVLQPSALAEDVLVTAEKQRATVIYGSPFHFALLAADPGDFTWPSLRLPIATAAALPEATARAFETRFGQPLVQGLGIIEVGLSVLNLDAPSAKPASLGKPLPGYQVKLLDEHGREVADGTPGEFHVRGPGLLDAYLVPWDPQPLKDGYFASGDLVIRDSDGHLTLVGRKKSVINVAGMKVFPEEVESVLNLHPGVERARVFARDHPQTGQVPVAEIVATDPSSPPASRELQQYCRTHLSSYKVPIRFAMVTHLPLTPSGKIRRT